MVYNVVLDALQSYELQFIQRGMSNVLQRRPSHSFVGSSKGVASADVVSLLQLLKKLLLYVPEKIFQRWQMRSIGICFFVSRFCLTHAIPNSIHADAICMSDQQASDPCGWS